MTADKASLRTQYAQLRRDLSPEIRAQASAAMTTKLQSLPAIQTTAVISCFISKDPEINTHSLISQLLSLGKSVCVPRVNQDLLVLHHITSLDDCIPGAMGILEPRPTLPQINPDQVEVFIVPGLAFDTFGHRLGYGKGYYDRLLQDVKGYTIGICYTDQLVYELPHTKTDIPLDLILTDTISVSIN